MPKADKPVRAERTISLCDGLIDIPTDLLRVLDPVRYTTTGAVVVAYDRRRAIVIHDDGKPVVYTVTMTAQRDPINEEEAVQATAAKAGREERLAKEKTEETEQQKMHERALNAAYDKGMSGAAQAARMAKDSQLEILTNLEKFAPLFEAFRR